MQTAARDLAASPEGIATEATCYLQGVDQTGAVRIDADSTLDFSMWAMGTAADATDNLTGRTSPLSGSDLICRSPSDLLNWCIEEAFTSCLVDSFLSDACNEL